MTTTELHAYCKSISELQKLRELLTRTRARFTQPGHPTYRLGSTRASHYGDALSASSARLEELEALYARKWHVLMEQRIAFERLLSTLTAQERVLMRYHYDLGLSLSQVALKMGYSADHVKRLHSAIANSTARHASFKTAQQQH